MSLFGGGSSSSSQSTTTSHETSLNVQSSVAGKVLAVVLGTKRIAGNLIWYSDFTAVAHETESGGDSGKGGGGNSGSSSTSYTYTCSVMIGLSVGTIASIGKVWKADDEVSLGGLGSIVTVKAGDVGQDPWSWMLSGYTWDQLPHSTISELITSFVRLQITYGEQALGYSGLAYVGIASADLGSSSSLPNWNWEVRGLGSPVVTDDDGSFDIGFPEAIGLIVENAAWGCGLSGIMGDLADYTAWCQAHGFVMSDDFTDAKSARDIITDYLTATLAEAVWTGDKVKIVPYADQSVGSYEPDLVPVLAIDASMLLPGESDDEGPVKVVRQDPADLYNYVSVEYHDRSNAYNTATVTATDDAHIATYGLRPGSSLSAHFLTSAEIAQHVADLVQAREIGVSATYEFGLGPIGAILEPMDIVSLTDEGQGLVAYPVRIKRIEERGDRQFGVTAEEIPGCIGAMVSRTVPVGQGYKSQYNTDPGQVNTPILFEPPDALTTNGLELWAAVSGGSIWGGAEVWVSQDEAGYRRVGVIAAPARQGFLAANLSSGGEIDATNTLSVDLSVSRGSLSSGSLADVTALNTLSLVEGELLAYRDATLTGPYAYDLSYLVRGAHGTDIAAHPAGAPFARLDGAIFKYPFTADRLGSTLYIKFVSFNIWGGGGQTLADVEPFAYTLRGTALASPLPDVAGLTTAYVAGITNLTWTAVSDFRSVDYEIRQGESWSSAQVIGRTPNTQAPSFGDGTYWVAAHYKVANGPDVYSASPASVEIAGSQLTSNVLAGFDEAASGWTGTADGLAMIGGSLLPAGAGDIAAVPDISVIDDIAFYGGRLTAGGYAIPAAHRVDVGRVVACQVLMSASVRGQSLYDLPDCPDVAGLTDVSDSSLGPSVTATPQLRLSRDGDGFGDWSDWIPGSYTARAFDFRVKVATLDGQAVPLLTGFAFSVDVPDRTDSYTALPVPADGLTVAYADGMQGNPAAAFNGGPQGQTVPNLQITIVGNQAGDDPLLTEQSCTGFTLRIVNGGAGVARTVNIIAQGY